MNWAQPRLALSNLLVAWVPMSIGAAPGDILPGPDRPPRSDNR